MMLRGSRAVVGDDEEVLVVLDDARQEQGAGPLADQAALRVQSADLQRRVAIAVRRAADRDGCRPGEPLDLGLAGAPEAFAGGDKTHHLHIKRVRDVMKSGLFRRQ
jgi:hypothetical protein